MADAVTTTVATLETLQKDQQDTAGQIADVTKSVQTLTDTIAEMAKARKAPAVQTGELQTNSRRFSFARLCKAVALTAIAGENYRADAKIELELCAKVRKEMAEMGGNSAAGLSQFCAPLSTAMLPQRWEDVGANPDDVKNLSGFSGSLIKEIQDHFAVGVVFDPAEAQRYGLMKSTHVRNDATLGGTLVPLAAQGELIEVLRNSLSLTRAGVRMVPLPPQGSVRYPRQNTAGSVSGIAEGVAATESNVTTGEVLLNAKEYRGFMKYTDTLLRFAGIPSFEALLREDLGQVTSIQMDRDSLDGQGGTKILGVLNHSGIKTRDAATVATNGNTLGTSDPALLIADMAGANAPVDRGFAWLIRPELWAGVMTRKDSQGRYVFDWAPQNMGMPMTLFNRPAYESSNVPNTRNKGTGTNLTVLIGIVPSEILMGQAGIVDFANTNSDGEDFRAGVNTLRVTTFGDMNLRHDVSVGKIDELLNS